MREEYPLLWARRGVTLCSAQETTLGKKKAELQTLLKLIATLWKQGKISGVCRENGFTIGAKMVTGNSFSLHLFHVTVTGRRPGRIN